VITEEHLQKQRKLSYLFAGKLTVVWDQPDGNYAAQDLQRWMCELF
jgi:hypothetical protein